MPSTTSSLSAEFEAIERRIARFGVGYDLHQHRVVVGRHLHPLPVTRVDPQARPFWQSQRVEGARRREEVFRGTFGVQPSLDGEPRGDDPILREFDGEILALRLSDLRADQVDARHHLRNRMLDLNAGVHLEKEILAAFIVVEKLDGSSALVTTALSELDGDGAHRGSLTGFEGRRCRLLDHLLVAALHRAVTVEQMHRAPVAKSEHLHLDVTRAGHEMLEINGAVAEGSMRDRRRLFDGIEQPRGFIHAPHTDAAAAGRRLHEQGVTNSAALGQHLRVGSLEHASSARYRKPRFDSDAASLLLVAHRGDDVRARTDKADSDVAASAGEIRVFGQESVTGVQQRRPRRESGVDNCLLLKVALRGGGRSDQNRLVGQLDMRRLSVGFGVNGDGGQAELFGRAHHPARDLPAVGDYELLEHYDLPCDAAAHRGAY